MTEYCGTALIDKLKAGGLSDAEIRKLSEVISGWVAGFKSTSLSYDEYGRIIDWDNYYQEASIAERSYQEDIEKRIRAVHPSYFHVIFYNHKKKDGGVCLEALREITVEEGAIPLKIGSEVTLEGKRGVIIDVSAEKFRVVWDDKTENWIIQKDSEVIVVY